jgi:hypothetical protein
MKKMLCFFERIKRKYFSTGSPRDQENISFLQTNNHTIFLLDFREIKKYCAYSNEQQENNVLRGPQGIRKVLFFFKRKTGISYSTLFPMTSTDYLWQCCQEFSFPT